MIEWLAVSLAGAVLYPFGAGLTYRVLGPTTDAPQPAKPPAPPSLFTESDKCGCTQHFSYGGAWTERCEWHAAHRKGLAAGALWPLYWAWRGVALMTTSLFYALYLVPRAIFRLGAGKLSMTVPVEGGKDAGERGRWTPADPVI